MARDNARWCGNARSPLGFPVCSAARTLHTQPSGVRTGYLIIEPATDPPTAGMLSLSLPVFSDYGGGYFVFAGDGAVKQPSLPSWRLVSQRTRGPNP